jgi:DNA-directed RNA polymerase specialized sigma24 family protein
MSVEKVKEKLCGGSGEELKELSAKIAAIIKREFSSRLDFEDLASEVALILLEKREELCKRRSLNLSFLVITVRNRLIDKHVRKKSLQTVSIFEKEEESRSLEESLEGETFNALALLNAREAVELLKGELSEKELETLCFRVHSALYRKEENPFLREKSKDARDKAWSRLRPKVEKLLKEFDFSPEEAGIFGELLLSECLKKFRLSNCPEGK